MNTGSLLGQGGVAERPVWISRNGNAVNGRRERGDSQAQAEGQSQRQGDVMYKGWFHHPNTHWLTVHLWQNDTGWKGGDRPAGGK